MKRGLVLPVIVLAALLTALVALSGTAGADGEVEWIEQFAADQWENFNRSVGVSSVSADSTGVYVVGTTFGPLPGFTYGGADAFIRKYDLQGTSCGPTSLELAQPMKEKAFPQMVPATSTSLAS